MKKRIIVIAGIIVFAMQGAVLLADESQETKIQALTDKIQQLDNRVKQLEDIVLKESQAKNRSANLRKRFEARLEQDRKTYTQQDLKEIESLYQIANKQWNSPEAQESLKKLTDKYAKANRTGCALLYLGQMASGEEKEKYLKRAVDEFSDCWYGDGVQVGAYARFYLANYYQESGKKAEASTLFDEIRKDYPDAIDHKGRLLADMYVDDQRNACENNMRWIEAAKDQWAIENGKTNGTTVDINGLVNGKYLPEKFLKCPSGGQYKYNAIGENCRCSIHGTVPKSGNKNIDSAAKNNWNYWQKFNEWEALMEGKKGMPKDEAKADQILTQLIKGVYLVKFAPADGFNPQTPTEFLQAFHKTSSLRSGKDRLGGSGFFRTKCEDNKLIASFLTEQPDQMKQDIEKNSQLAFIYAEKITPDKFISHIKSTQESLRNEPVTQAVASSVPKSGDNAITFFCRVQAEAEISYEIRIDGKKAGSGSMIQNPKDKMTHILSATPGDHVLTVTASGYETWQKTITLSDSNAGQNISAEMKKTEK